MTAPLPAIPVEASQWDQALYAFLIEKGNRSGLKRTVESYSRMLWRFYAGRPGRPTPSGHRVVVASTYLRHLAHAFRL